jgi:serine/threonine-protein kinase
MADLLSEFWEGLRDRYRLERQIGQGGMAAVFLAHDLRNHRPVAIKVLRPELATAVGIDRFLDEIAKTAILVHPHILPLFDSGECRGQLFYVMPYVEGDTLRARLDRERQLPIDDAVRIGCEVAEALAYAHAHNTIHRDIKPENILFMSGRAIVADFGLARAVSSAEKHLTLTGMILGTASYMSPEQALGSTELDGRCDIYSLACVVHEMLAGDPPFTGTNQFSIIARMIVEQPPPLRKVRASVSAALEEAVLKGLAKTPADRYPLATDFAEALRPPSTPDLSVSEESIAVLPFANRSAEPDLEYFSDGISEEIINVLARISGLRVAARTSSFAFRNLELGPAEIGSRLRVVTVLEGSVKKQGTKLRITARLVKCSTGFVLWSETYDREMTDVWAIQEEIARTIADRLHVTFDPGSAGPVVTAPTHDLDAYHLYLKGRYHWSQRGSGLQLALQDFGQALRLDPEYAEAYAGLADALTLLGIHGLADPGSVIPRAREATQRALALAPDLADAHCAAGTLKLVFEWDWSGAESELRRALELNGRLVAAQYWLGIYFGVIAGRTDEGVAHVRRAIELDPLSAVPRAHLGMVLMAAGRHDMALKPLRESVALAPTLYLPYLYLGVALRALGRPVEAIPELEAAARLSGRAPIALASLAAAFGHLNRMGDVEAIHDELRARARREYVQTAVLSITSAVLGRFDEAFTLLHRACDERDGVLMYSRAFPAFEGLQNDPRMGEIYRRIGLPGAGG